MIFLFENLKFFKYMYNYNFDNSSSGCPNSPNKNDPPLKKIGVMQISKVLSEVYGSSSATNSQESIPLQQKLIVCTLLLMVKQGKLKEVTMGKVSVLFEAFVSVQIIEELPKSSTFFIEIEVMVIW